MPRKMREVLSANYTMSSETPEQLLERVAKAGATFGRKAPDVALKARLLTYLQKNWFLYATPILLNAGAVVKKSDGSKTLRGLTISCFLNEMTDTLQSINDTFAENFSLATSGGGVATNYSNLRARGELIRGDGPASGIQPLLKVQEAYVHAAKKGGRRNGSTAAYLRIDHPEILEFIKSISSQSSGDERLRLHDLFLGVLITDDFMNAVQDNLDWHLKNHLGEVVRSIKAQDLWRDLLVIRHQQGHPYIIFIDTVNASLPDIYKAHNLKVTTSNLCTEIMLHTGTHQGIKSTGVCCLGSLNIEHYDEWKNDPQFIKDVITSLDNILETFIYTVTTNKKKYAKHLNAAHSAKKERSIGLGVMGYHSYLQSKMVPFEEGDEINKEIFSHIKDRADLTNYELAQTRGACPYGEEVWIQKRFSHVTAIAPTASISLISSTSACIEPYPSNIYDETTIRGRRTNYNKYLKAALEPLGLDKEEIWTKILKDFGSVQRIDEIPTHIKAVFKTAFEIDQEALIRQAGERQKYIDQSQSLNIFVDQNDGAQYHNLHMLAWSLGVKSLYYLRGKPHDVRANIVQSDTQSTCSVDQTDCMACQ